MVNEYYPELIKKAESFKLKGYIYLSGLLQDKHCKNQYVNSYNLIMKDLSHDLFKIILNPYIGMRSKVKALLIATKIYMPVRKIINKLSN